MANEKKELTTMANEKKELTTDTQDDYNEYILVRCPTCHHVVALRKENVTVEGALFLKCHRCKRWVRISGKLNEYIGS